jgi:uncharacterized membrane protein YhhN
VYLNEKRRISFLGHRSCSFFFPVHTSRDLGELYKTTSFALVGIVLLSKKIFLVALLFSWVGDLLLMGEGPLFFLLGILSFWVAQLFYLYFINKEIELPLNEFFFSKKGLISLLLFGGYFLGTMSLLSSKLGALTIPVSGYAITLASIGVAAMLLWMTKKNNKTFALFAGVLLFIVSDSMIAFNTFYFEKNIFGFWVMATYIPAQFLICNYFKNNFLNPIP